MKKAHCIRLGAGTCSLLLGVCAIPVQAEDDSEIGPPIQELFRTELVFPQARGEVQLGTLPVYADGPEGSTFLFPIGMEYGITDSLQFGVEWDAYIDADSAEEEESGSGQGNLTFGLMYSWIDIRDSGFHVGAGFEYELASGDRKFLEGSTREDSQELYLILAKDLEEGSRSQIFMQVGVELQDGGKRDGALRNADLDLDADDEGSEKQDPNVWFANVGGYTTWRDLVWSLELNLSEEEEERYVTPGVTYHPADAIEIGLGVALGIADEADDYQIIGKLIWEFSGA